MGKKSLIHSTTRIPQTRRERSPRGYKNIIRPIILLGMAAPLGVHAQGTDSLSQKITTLNEVVVSATRANEKMPVSYSEVKMNQLSGMNLGQDIPVLLNFMPSVVFTSDAGNGIGYTTMRVRGTDPSRTNITLNGIPLNDAESNSVFWVNISDLASSVEEMQLQRGVGTSTNGSGAFGASLNMQTERISEDPYGLASVSLGSFGTQKYSAKFSSGLMRDKFEISGRFSKIKSNGYIDRASSDMTSYFVSGAYLANRTMVKLLAFGGQQKTYQAWNGLWAPLLDSDRKFNSSGAILKPGADKDYFTREDLVGYYHNQSDNYKQNVVQLHATHSFSPAWKASLALHYTLGEGYYENYKNQDKFSKYGLPEMNGLKKSDFVTQKHMYNQFYGGTFNVNYDPGKVNLVLGGAWTQYDGDHFGKVIWAKDAENLDADHQWYRNHSVKTDFNAYIKAMYSPVEKLTLFGDVQYRYINYEMGGLSDDLIDFNIRDNFNFINPKIGLSYDISRSNRIFISYARSNKEPNRSDYTENLEKKTPTYETLDDGELGWEYNTQKVRLGANLYYMYYTNQLIPTGAVTETGRLIRENAGKSYRAGLEFQWAYAPVKWFKWQGNFTLSRNTLLDYKAVTYDEDWNEQVSDFGNTKIAMSPDVIASNAFVFTPLKKMNIALMTKYVGEQFIANENYSEYKLDNYCVTDLNMSYDFHFIRFFRQTQLTLLVNNLFDTKYISNGIAWGKEDVYYFPQAGINFLVGLNLGF